MKPFTKNVPSEHKRTAHPPDSESPPKQRRRDRCAKESPDGTQDTKLKVLWWNSPSDYVPISSEEAMIEALMRWKKKERGMVRDQPPFRLAKIKKQLSNVRGITLPQALSLRRHHMKLLNPKIGMESLKLGKEKDILESAQIFEQAVEEYLVKCRVAFWTETEQKEIFLENRREGEQLTCTPDFKLRREVLLKRVRERGGDSRILEERKIHWIEAKMFYGASTIPHGSMGAVGSVLPKAKKYVKEFGEGAIIFMQGCGDQLAADLAEIGVTALDCSGAVSLKNVQQHQRTWCADENGVILS
jgi:hypothetical protein